MPHGKNSYLSVDSDDLSAYLKTTGLEKTQDTHDVTCFGSSSKNYIPGLKDGVIPLEGVWGTTVDGHMADIETAQDSAGYVAFIYGPNGSTAGYVKYSGNAILTNYNPNAQIDGEIKFSASLQVTGGVTRGTF